jgi:DNA-binding transcriptional LysR family regulator
VAWLNSPPLTSEGLRGKVVLIDFWTYSCINCLRSIPYIKAWAEKYKDHGLVVIGVHTPEFAFERKVSNVQAAVSDLKIGYPVAVDSEYAIWRSFDNEYWPAHILPDLRGLLVATVAGAGITVLPDYLCRSELAEERLALLHEPRSPPGNDIHLAWRKGRQHPRTHVARDMLLKGIVESY